MERFIEVPGGRLLVVDDGDGPPIILVHAAIADHRAWDAMIPGLVAAGFHAIRHDLRGLGRSTTADVAFSNRADVIAILDGFRIDRAVLVGNSAGGQMPSAMVPRTSVCVTTAATTKAFETDIAVKAEVINHQTQDGR